MSNTEIAISMAKALYYVQNAQHHFEFIKAQPSVKFKAKDFINHQINRLNGIKNDMSVHLTPESFKALQAELNSDTMVFESIKDKLVLMNQEQRWEVEAFIDNLLKPTSHEQTT